MWNGKKKAVTFSYDDGVMQDIRFIELLEHYGLRGTFNINLGRQRETDTFIKSGVLVRHIAAEDLPAVYAGHEVAGHTYSHVHLESMTDEEAREEIGKCHDGLQQLFGYEIMGMAYPYGTYSHRTVEILAQENVKYARTCVQTETFSVPDDLLCLATTCRHANRKLLELARAFVSLKTDTQQLFYIWGHSYEFDECQNWEVMEEFCKIISGHADIFYGTNSEVLLDKKQS